MADFCDLATERTDQLLEDALARHQRAVLAAPATSALYCEECDTAIPLARREAIPGCQTCVECQALLERRGRA
ncbi:MULTISPECIES: TraR/DksA C4-type zinc finger protein [unclassified Pseudomonas]|uniref:TraR/DksA C4-type zinc finger protein n=1 Tax=unclassified Pseudomonas TaxID=196821 RepID=UPI00244C349D|nr:MULTISPECIES: TraR/DksA C4-type zinc finger protein [unclassified Pseudomonas]MDG9928514.1 TraR/DksA C4-type zinc finger protein [Pseudomonas sp. GD04042]MDH0482684.1 TraR/DksA C4-type zinc finger protein [Pseudomonas sp. GD04015]MDH0604614.1 TraR/DksA C4-type zinc finger protein [Pseudomonas sp. GD03869]